LDWQRVKMQCPHLPIRAHINHQATNGYKWYSITSLLVLLLLNIIDMRGTRLVRCKVLTAISIMTVLKDIVA
jgi:hypothetical protein